MRGHEGTLLGSWGAPGAPLDGCTPNRPAVPEQKPGCRERHGQVPTSAGGLVCSAQLAAELWFARVAGVSWGDNTVLSARQNCVYLGEKKKRILKELSGISICQNDSCPLGHSPENSHAGPWPNLQKTLGTNQVLNNALIQRDYTGRPQCRTPPCSGFQPLPGPYASGGEDNEDIRTRPRPGEGRCFPAAVPATLISAEARRYSPAAPSRPSALGRA